jgi:hypothetical protein
MLRLMFSFFLDGALRKDAHAITAKLIKPVLIFKANRKVNMHGLSKA